jgi:hypothetical protein
MVWRSTAIRRSLGRRGNFNDNEVDPNKGLGLDTDQPHSVRYKPLVHA